LRQAHAVDRHRFWTIGFAAVLLLPALTVALPPLDVPVPAWRYSPAREISRRDIDPPRVRRDAALATPLRANAIGPPDERTSQVSTATLVVPSRIAWPSLRGAFLAVWAIGAGAAIAMILLSLARVSHLRRAGEELDDDVWREAAATLAAQLGLSRPVRLIVHRDVTTPMAGGVWRPVIFLPASARGWSAEQRAIVLAHELAHLRGCDPPRLIAARLAVALYWFHPLAWLAARQSSVAREQACDAAVLSMGTRPSAYARVLLDFAESMTPRGPTLAALPIVEPSLLETRLMAILKDDRRPAARSRIFLPLALGAAATLTIAAARPLAVTTLPLPASVSLAAALPPSAASAAAPPAPQRRSGGNLACWTGGVYGSSFSGTITSTGSGVTRQIGTSGADRVIEERLGDLEICMLAQTSATGISTKFQARGSDGPTGS
jgi:beta-lactamase regulating signal transducer with metallopeptidase domain